MQLVINEHPYELFESITGARLGDIRDIQRVTKARGHEITIPRLRSYLLEDVIKSDVNFGFVDTDEKVLCLQSLIVLCRRHAGEECTFEDADTVALAEIVVRFEVQAEADEAPKDPTASAADDGDETTS